MAYYLPSDLVPNGALGPELADQVASAARGDLAAKHSEDLVRAELPELVSVVRDMRAKAVNGGNA